jgi:outer membrane protein
MADIFKRHTGEIIIILLLAFLICPCAFCKEAEGKKSVTLSLEETIAIAFRNNKNILIQENEIEAAQASILGAQSAFLPKVNLGAGYARNSAVLGLGLSTAKKDLGVFTGYKNDNQLGISIGESLYNGGANIADLQQARLGLEVQKETLAVAKLDVEFEAKRLYYGLLLAYETERITQDLLSQAQSHYKDVENKFKQGTSSRFDLLQSKVHVSKILPELVKAKNAAELISADLKKLLGLKMQDTITLKEQLVYTLIDIREDEFLKQAYLAKPEMVLKSLGIDISRWAIQGARAGWRPQINADASYNYRSNDLSDMFNKRHNDWNAGLSVTIPIFDGFSTKAKVDQAKARYAEANLQKEDLVETIAVDIRRACLDLQQAESIINSQKDNIEEAKEALRIAQVSYDNGEGTNLDILDAQVSLSQIEKNLSEGIYDYLMAKAYLDRTMGETFLKEVGNEKKD